MPHLSSQDSQQSIRHSAQRFFSGTLLSRISGMLRDVSMAYVFGAEASISSFMLAFRFSHLLRRLLGEGALQSAFIPEFEAIRHKDQKEAFFFFRDLMVNLTLLLVFVIFLGALGLGTLLTVPMVSESTKEILYLTLLMLPSLLFICLFGLNASLLQCEKSFFTSSAAPIAFNFIWIFVVILLKNTPHRQAMPLLALGVIIACFFQWLITLPRTYKILKTSLNKDLWKNIRLGSPEIKAMVKPLLLGIFGVAASQINNVIDSIFAWYAEKEGPAYLWYSIRLQQLPLALFGIAIAGALLPPLARAIKSSQWERFHSFMKQAFNQTFGLMIPLTAGIFILGDTSVHLIYGHGDFDFSSVLGTTYCLWAYGVGLLPSAMILIMAPACYAESNFTLPAVASLITLVLNCVLNTFFIIGMNTGAVGVALATSISAWVNFFVLWKYLSKKHDSSFVTKEDLNAGVEILIATMIGVITTLSFRYFIQDIPILYFKQGFSSQLIAFASQTTCFFGSFFATYCFQNPLFFSYLKNKLSITTSSIK